MKNRRRIYRKYCKSQGIEVTEVGYAVWLVKVIDIEEEAIRLMAKRARGLNPDKYPTASVMLHGVKQTTKFFESIMPGMARDKLSPEAKRFMLRELRGFVKLILEYVALLRTAK